MNRVTSVTIIALSMALAACGPDTARGGADNARADENGPAIEIDMVGGDRDSHGCIGSAGYVWSNLRAECVRLFEVGIALENMQDPESPSAAYLIQSGSNRLELFGLDAEPIQLLMTGPNLWQDADETVTVKLETPEQYTVYANERLLFSENKDGHDAHDGEGDESDGSDEHKDLLSASGLLTDVEDGAYPFASITVEFPKSDTRASFTLNVEKVAVDMGALAAQIGNMVFIDYTSDVIKDIVEIELESGFLNGTDNPADLRPYESVNGIMRDAQVTMGDLPGTFYIEDDGVYRTYFEDYVTEDMVAANGQPVVIYYSERHQNVIWDIRYAAE